MRKRELVGKVTRTSDGKLGKAPEMVVGQAGSPSPIQRAAPVDAPLKQGWYFAGVPPK
ncbi:MAG: hypothetical protein JRM73_00510 [Nitrososphaerota archaeon]|nr:hypothetical protein [Nitrososphaerota archaeon]